jgi:HAD superfamily hydrolase (TIGR01490 family)
MDHTLMDNDCDVSWKLFLVGKGIAPSSDLPLMEHYYRKYRDGVLDPDDFMSFQLKEFTGRNSEEMSALADEHYERFIRPRIYPDAARMVRELAGSGEDACLITGTNEVVARPVALNIGFNGFIATGLEVDGGLYTGRFTGEYCAGAGKIGYMRSYAASKGGLPCDTWYYGDSLVDVPVFDAVGHPCVVNPAGQLRDIAEKRNWRIIAFTPPAGG